MELGQLCHVFILGFLLVGSAAKTSRTKVYYKGTATWYEAAEGDGSEGGACGYKTMVHANGYKKRETAVSDVLFKNGLGCGMCYKVMCYGHPLCNKKPITVVAMDQSPGGSWPHFDLSGSAFGRMAIDNRFAAGLRNVGKLKVAWTSTPCTYGKTKIAFRVLEGSTPFWLSVVVEFENGVGDIGSMQIQKVNSESWQDMAHVWGASWCAQAINGPLQGPFNIRLMSSSQKWLTLNNAIPGDWEIEKTYFSKANFH